MTTLDAALGAMRDVPQWFIWRLEWSAANGKYDKTPCYPAGGPHRMDASLPANWMTYDTACIALTKLTKTQEVTYALGFWLTRESGYWLLDLDNATGPDGKLQPFAEQLVAAFPGAFIEWSSSRKGVHIIGRGTAPLHRTRPTTEVRAALAPMDMEFYTQNRGIAFGLTGEADGSADVPYDMTQLCAAYFPPGLDAQAGEFSTPRADWRGPADDDELIRRALNARSGASVVFGGKASFGQLWRGEVEQTSEHDMALASHLAFWTGCDGPRIERLMRQSGLSRDKWNEHRTYLRDLTIARACAQCERVYVERQMPPPLPPKEGSATDTSELSNAHRLLKLHGADLLAVEGIGWHVWQSQGPWRHDPTGVHRLAFALGQIIHAEADAMQTWVDDETVCGSDEADRRAGMQKNRYQWAKSSESRTVINNSLALLENLLPCKADTLDANPLLVGCPGGVIDLSTCTMRPHTREDRITKVIGCDFDPSARAPTWERFIGEVFGGDAELIRYVQTLTGYILSGHRGHHLLPVFYGTGANGKSTFLGTLQDLMGDYAGTSPAGLLVSSGANEHPTGIASLKGRRLVTVSETGEGGRLAETQVKLLTGGDRITARLMRQDFFEFEPTHMLILQTNHKPRVTGTDEGIWRRVKLVPFTVTIPPERRDPELGDKLLAELPGVLAWVVQGWRNYQREGFMEPRAVKAATAEYRSDSDHVGAFLSERCILGPEHTCPTAVLYGAYTAWCDEAGERPLSKRALGARLAERGELAQVRTNSARLWQGIAVDFGGPLRAVTPAPVSQIQR